MILKAGTYRFNDELKNFPETSTYYLGNRIVVDGYTLYYGIAKYNNTLVNGVSYTGDFFGFIFYIDDPLNGTLTPMYVNGTIGEQTFNNFWGTDTGEPIEDTIAEDVEVDDVYGTWYISNTNYNEINAKPLATIEYNGQVIASLNAGETATLKCGKTENTKYVMATDVVVKVNEVESEIPEGYIKPSGSLEITENGTVDVTNLTEVVVNVDKIIDEEPDELIGTWVGNSSLDTFNQLNNIACYGIEYTNDIYAGVYRGIMHSSVESVIMGRIQYGQGDFYSKNFYNYSTHTWLSSRTFTILRITGEVSVAFRNWWKANFTKQ